MSGAINRVTPEDVVSLATDVGPAPMQVGAVLLLDGGPDFDTDRATALIASRSGPSRGHDGESTSDKVVLRFATSMTTTKRKVSVSLDEDLVAELEAGGEALSSQVNEAIRFELDRRRRHRLLGEMLDELDAEFGPADERLVKKYMDLLG